MKSSRILLYSLLMLVVLGGLGLYLVYRIKNMETALMGEEARKNTTGQYITLSDGVTHYESGGPDTGRVILLVHGFSVPYYIWNITFDSLVNRGYHVVRYDEYGRGYSDRPDRDYTPDLYTRQISDLIGALHLKTPLTLMGVSFGGAVATDFAVHYPSQVSKLVLEDPVFPFVQPGTPACILNYIQAVQPEKQISGQLTDFKYPEHFAGWTDLYKVQMGYKGFRQALISTRLHYPGNTILSNYRALDSLHKSILLIWGKEDHTVPYTYSDSLRKILHTSFFPVGDAAHLPHLEKPKQVNQQILSFLEN